MILRQNQSTSLLQNSIHLYRHIYTAVLPQFNVLEKSTVEETSLNCKTVLFNLRRLSARRRQTEASLTRGQLPTALKIIRQSVTGRFSAFR